MFGPVAIDLYVVHGSHPCAAVERALELKGLDFRRIELPPPLHAPFQRVRFGARTVPAMQLDGGEKISGSRAILRRLDEIAPEPPLWPARRRGARARRARRGVGRRGLPADRAAPALGRAAALPRGARVLLGRLADPAARSRRSAPRRARSSGPRSRSTGATEGAVRADLRNLPRHLDRIDRWLAEGVIGGAQPNAADLQIATTTRLLVTIGDVAPFFAGRPAESHARDLFGVPARLGAARRPPRRLARRLAASALTVDDQRAARAAARPRRAASSPGSPPAACRPACAARSRARAAGSARTAAR